MNSIEYYKERFDKLQAMTATNGLSVFDDSRRNAFNTFSKLGIPTSKNEEWKYTRIGSLFNKEFRFLAGASEDTFKSFHKGSIRLPGYENANEIVFINGLFNGPLTEIRSDDLVVMLLEQAAASKEYKEFVFQNYGHSGQYLKDGINALNSSFAHFGAFVHIKKGVKLDRPVYIYNITNASSGSAFSHPRCLIYADENTAVQIVETYVTIGTSDSLINQVTEVVVDKDAVVEYYKIQNDNSNASQVSTTHIRQIAKSYIHTVTVSLNGGIVRNNLNVIMEAERSEAHLYGLYFQSGSSHIDNHTVVDNVKPNCYSNELYKGIMNDEATGVFNGKIFVRQDAQKTNAYQSNKNILLSDNASINSKPQLEIFADDVKCSHGCTVGQLDEDALFYLQSRGISESTARSLLVHAFAEDILERIKPAPIKKYIEQLISKRLEPGIE